MLLITTHCDQPDCDGTVEFVSRDAERHADGWSERRARRRSERRFGTCDSCRATYSLHGGTMERLDGTRDAVDRRQPVANGAHGLAC